MIDNRWMKHKAIKALLVENREIAKNTFFLSFDIGGEDFSFTAGQYLKLALDSGPSTRDNCHEFSIASSPTDKQLAIATRGSDSIFKQSLLNGPLGRQVFISGPFGYFILPIEPSAVCFIAGGIGITPFRSMMRYLDKKSLGHKISLIYINHNQDTAIFLEELRNFYKRGKINLVERYGPLDKDMIEEKIISLNNNLFFIAGKSGMVLAVRQILINLNIPETNIQIDEFAGYE
jgi:ferredoxin-NADP reductase